MCRNTFSWRCTKTDRTDGERTSLYGVGLHSYNFLLHRGLELLLDELDDLEEDAQD
jgi:hypothetical protein